MPHPSPTVADLGVILEGKGTRPSAPGVCKFCDQPATKSFLWAEGMAQVKACDAHHAKARSDNYDEVVKTVAVEGKADTSAAGRRRHASRGQAMRDGSYPVASAADLHNAVQAIGRAKNPGAVRRHIKRRAAKLGLSHTLPDGWSSSSKSLAQALSGTQGTKDDAMATGGGVPPVGPAGGIAEGVTPTVTVPAFGTVDGHTFVPDPKRPGLCKRCGRQHPRRRPRPFPGLLGKDLDLELEFKAFDEKVHPRDSHGRFIHPGDDLKFKGSGSGGPGYVAHVEKIHADGTASVTVDGKKFQMGADQIKGGTNVKARDKASSDPFLGKDARGRNLLEGDHVALLGTDIKNGAASTGNTDKNGVHHLPSGEAHHTVVKDGQGKPGMVRVQHGTTGKVMDVKASDVSIHAHADGGSLHQSSDGTLLRPGDAVTDPKGNPGQVTGLLSNGEVAVDGKRRLATSLTFQHGGEGSTPSAPAAPAVPDDASLTSAYSAPAAAEVHLGDTVAFDGDGQGTTTGTVKHIADNGTLTVTVDGKDQLTSTGMLDEVNPPAAPAAPAPKAGGMHVPRGPERTLLRIPPAWTDVRVADDPTTATVIAHGRDGKGRATAIYSDAHSKRQAQAKFARIREFRRHVPALDAALARDAGSNDTAAAVLVMRHVGTRVGSTTDTKAKVHAYGTTTLEARHVTVTGDTTRFDFVGKKGVHIQLVNDQPEVAAAMRSRLAGKQPGERIFETSEAKTIAYLRAQTAPGFKNHDLRTHLANVVAKQAVQNRPDAPTSKAEFSRARNAVGDVVAAQLGNNRSEALKSYVDPQVFTPWLADGRWLS